MARTIGATGCRGIGCSEKVAIGETAGGSLSMKCHFCGFSAYAQPGTRAARQLRAAMTPMDDEPSSSSSPAADPVPAGSGQMQAWPKPEAIKAKAKAPAQPFDLSQLVK